ncbi:unnamed protein product [Mortierella alpina]
MHEHCQKMGWEKPTFNVKRTPRGFVSTVVLGKRNKKTGQIETASFTLQDNFKPTAVEARHYGATYALHRVNSHKSLMMVLPPDPEISGRNWMAKKQRRGPVSNTSTSPIPSSVRQPSSSINNSSTSKLCRKRQGQGQQLPPKIIKRSPSIMVPVNTPVAQLLEISQTTVR